MVGESYAGPDPWNEDVAGFVEAHLTASPGRVLDVGCGEGWLCRRLADKGHQVRGIDPEAPDGALFERVTLEEFGGPGPFGTVVAITSLHHIQDLTLALDKIAGLLGPGGTLIAVEFAWDRFDDATARWCLDRLPRELGDDNWLHRRCAPIRDRFLVGEPLRARDDIRRWAGEEGFHSSTEMLRELRGRFTEVFFSWSPYLYPDLDSVTESQERAAIGSGTIQAIGVRFVGERLRPGGP
jgi:SAM-dependent methyltransferase